MNYPEEGLIVSKNIEFLGQIAIVTGAASGIGEATARVLASRGATVVLADRNEEQLFQTAGSFDRAGLKVSSCVTDISDAESVKGLVAHSQALGDVTILVNSAGVTGPLDRPTHELGIDEFDATYGVNLRGAVLLTMAVLPGMIQQSYGRILHVASIAGKEGNPNMAPYNMAKAGLIGFVKGCAKEYATQGITVNAIAPAVIRGPMMDAEPREQIEYMLGKIPMRRLGEPGDVAEVISFAVSPACNFTTGFVFDASGGRATY
jgi:3-oxoacyl-[acyl-carrier protein] reductase